ncbi:hypothetical protein [Falsiphaeobacter marinintestinus]|uniref:hypothetical protein n=1 Tax=Falsiphaeobacter marinintestinus TaxID=1492905 RepID=UPI00164744B5|nr:hypothetical protein [Phaeobacter marinintestinus]
MRYSRLKFFVGLTGILQNLILAVWLVSGTADAQALVSPTLQEFTTTLEEPLQVEIGIKIDQVTDINQKAENFTVVAGIRMRWQDPLLAFDDQAGSKLMTSGEFVAHARSIPTHLPLFLFQNQQAQRWEQEAFVSISADGTANFFERSTLTLQAPYFDFEKYPFDTQKFSLDIVSIPPLDMIEFVPFDEVSGLGETLGEEAWILENPTLTIGTTRGITGMDSATASLTFSGRRHLQYYVIRIFIPMLILIAVSWVSFFLEDLRKRIDMASANLLVFVAFNFAVSESLPHLGYITFLDFVLQSMFMVTATVIIMNVVLRRLKLRGRESLAISIDNYIVKWVFPLGYLGVIAYASYRFLLS